MGVWWCGGIAAHGRTPLVIINGNLNAQCYLEEVARPHVLPFVRVREGTWPLSRTMLDHTLQVPSWIFSDMRMCWWWLGLNVPRIVGGIYRHPNGNVSHFISDLEAVLNHIDNDKTAVLAGDLNIDIIKFSNEDVVSYVTTLMFYGYLPYMTLPSRITDFSMTCIDHIFVRLTHREKVLNI